MSRLQLVAPAEPQSLIELRALRVVNRAETSHDLIVLAVDPGMIRAVIGGHMGLLPRGVMTLASGFRVDL